MNMNTFDMRTARDRMDRLNKKHRDECKECRRREERAAKRKRLARTLIESGFRVCYPLAVVWAVAEGVLVM